MYRFLSPFSAIMLFCCAICVSLQAQEPRVPGLLELVVYRPGIHDRGLPKAILEDIKRHKTGDVEDGAEAEEEIVGQEIIIPPTVHVHRYYYSGDKEYQGPIVNGGPTLVVAKHPETGQQMYVEVVLPTGAPLIAYNKNSITYVYTAQRVSVNFKHSRRNPNRAIVEYHGGRGVKRRVHEHLSNHLQKTRQHLQPSPTVESIKSACSKSHSALKDGAATTRNAVKTVCGGLKSVVSVFPGVTPLLNPSDDAVTRKYRAKADAAASKARRTATEYVPTIR